VPWSQAVAVFGRSCVPGPTDLDMVCCAGDRQYPGVVCLVTGTAGQDKIRHVVTAAIRAMNHMVEL